MRYVDRQAQPCEVCGVPTRAEVGICQRTEECRSAYARKQYGAKALTRQRYELPEPIPCESCGKPTRSAYRVCKANPDCARIQQQRRYLKAVHAHPRSGQCMSCEKLKIEIRRLTRLQGRAAPPVEEPSRDRDCPNCLAKEQFFSREIRRLTRLLEAAGIDPNTATPSLLRPKGNTHVNARRD